MKKTLRIGVQVILMLTLLLFSLGLENTQTVYAAAPSNDDIDSPKIIGSIPYIDNLDTTEATQATDDPFIGNDSYKPCEQPPNNHNLNPGVATVWYKYSPGFTDTIISIDTIGSTTNDPDQDYDTFIAVWTGTRGNLSLVACDDDIHSGFQSQLTINALAGTTYYIEVGQYNGKQCTPSPSCIPTPSYNGGNLKFHVSPATLPTPWVGGVSIVSDKNVVAVGRPHIGSEVASYDGFTNGSLTAYVPMLFKTAFGSYDSALYVQNVHDSNTASITVKYYDSSGTLNCTKADTIAPLASKGYWVPSATCDTGSLPAGWVGGAVVTSTQPIVAVGRPHVGVEVMTYDGFTGGSLTVYVPMLFKGAFGSYDSAFYIQNVHASNSAGITIKYYDSSGTLNCTKADTIAPLASKGYWVPSATCDTGSLPVGWVGGVVVTSTQPIVAVGRPHIGSQITTYNGFTGGSLISYVPMLFKGAFGSYDSAFYIQNTHASNSAGITIKYYDSSGTLNCTKADTIAPLASKGYWVPSATCDTGALPAGWVGGVIVTSTHPIVAVGRPHIGAQVTTYDGFTGGSLNSYLPMLFKGAFGSYDSAFYIQNTETSTATVTIKFYDTSGTWNCVRTDTIPALSTFGFWVPSVTC